MGEKLHPNEYDGIYFLPGEEDNELVIHCWEFKANTEYAGATPIEGNQIGNMLLFSVEMKKAIRYLTTIMRRFSVILKPILKG